MKSKSTIEVNGKTYDAVTGKVLGAASAPQLRSGQNIDGFFRSRTSAAQVLKSPPIADKLTVLGSPHSAPKPHRGRTVNHARAHTPEPAKTVGVRVTSSATHTQKLTVHRTPSNPNHAKAHATQHSKTLMRSAVKRPAPSFHKQANTLGTLQHAVPSLIVPKKSVVSLDSDRLVRAQQTGKSPLVAHHATQVRTIQPQLASLSVQPVPEPSATPPATPPSPMPTNKPTDIFEHALMNASHFVDVQAHKAHFKKKARRHAVSMAAATLALVVIAGFAAYQNSTGLQFKIASMQAGFTTKMPNLDAAGFAYNGVKAGDSKLTVGFSGASGNYQLTEAPTNWSDQDMIQSVGATDASGKPLYETVQAGNVQVYRFDNTQATWVQNGQWYTVTGSGALSDSQVQSLVEHV